MSDDIKNNLLSPAHWLRILVMIFFAVVTWVLGIILTVLVVAQALFSLITGRDNANLRQLGGSLSLYFYQVLRFLTYRSEFRPFPFAPFPIDDESEEDPAVHLRTPGAARAAQSPVVKPDFASEHEPEPAAGPAMTAAATAVGAHGQVGGGPAPAATTSAGPTLSATQTGGTAIQGMDAESAAEQAKPLTGQEGAEAGSPDVTPLEVPGATGSGEARLETPGEPEIIITERIPPGPPSSGEGGQDSPEPQASVDEQHKPGDGDDPQRTG